MKNSRIDLTGMMKYKVLIICLLLGVSSAFGESKNDAQTIEEVTKFAEESSRMREEHIKETREIHLKHINEMYDKKLAHNKELTDLWKQLRPGDKEGNKALREQIKQKHVAFSQEGKKFKEDFKHGVMKKRHSEFRELMKGRQKELKDKYKQ